MILATRKEAGLLESGQPELNSEIDHLKKNPTHIKRDFKPPLKLIRSKMQPTNSCSPLLGAVT